MSARFYYDGILPGVEKPSRYIDQELNLARDGYAPERFNVLLVFPDVYEIGMTHQGLRLLYRLVSGLDGVGVEYAFAPWPDMEKRLRSTGEPLRSWQSGTPLPEFDLIGITIPYELHYTNILAILDTAGIPIEASARKGADPLVVAGGPCAYNPLPILPALDAVFIGDGEESLCEAVEALRGLKKSGAGREKGKEALAAIEGVYVEGMTGSAAARVFSFSDGDLPRRPIVPSASIVHERLAVEVMRGCTRGCRFCHAGMTYRPRRERSVGEIVDAVCSGLDWSGWEEVSLLSLSTSDYSCFPELLARLQPELEKRHVSLALPSLRPETVCEKVVAASSIVRRSGFTIAPEAGTGRLRKVINKGFTDEEILKGCANILDAGWNTLKLYFMIGLPTETEEDLEGIAGLIERILEIPRTRSRFRLNVSISPFVPRVQTPFQWERQVSPGEMAEKERFLYGIIRHRSVQLSMREPQVSALEGIFARGTGDLWPVLRSAYDNGCRFDGWRDMLDFDIWLKAIEAHGMSMDGLLGGFGTKETLPWERFGSNVTRKYLLAEREKAFGEVLTEDCASGGCSGCGACPGASIGNGYPGEMTVAGSKSGAEEEPAGTGKAAAGADAGTLEEENEIRPARYRAVYSKTGRARFLSHRELINIIQRALRRTGLPLRFSEGFHPHPKISLGPSLAVGMEGGAEFFDFELTGESEVNPSVFKGLLPEGLAVSACAGPFTKKEGKLSDDAVYHYRLDMGPLAGALGKGEDRILPGEKEMWYLLGREKDSSGPAARAGGPAPDDPASWLADEIESLIREKRTIADRKGRSRSCERLSIEACGDKDCLEISMPSAGSPGPKDLLCAVMPAGLAQLIVIRRTRILYRSPDGYAGPADLVAAES